MNKVKHVKRHKEYGVDIKITGDHNEILDEFTAICASLIDEGIPESRLANCLLDAKELIKENGDKIEHVK